MEDAAGVFKTIPEKKSVFGKLLGFKQTYAIEECGFHEEISKLKNKCLDIVSFAFEGEWYFQF